MPWNRSSPMSEREHFVREWMRNEVSKAALCRSYGISRQCGYKWFERFAEGEGLEEQSRAPVRRPQTISKELERLIIEAKLEKPHWGPKKLVVFLQKRHPTIKMPAASTAGEVLKRHQLVKPAGRRQRNMKWTTATALSQPWGPNAVWCLDFKGQFPTKDGVLCFPLTATDAFSRYLLVCKALTGVHTVPAQRALEAAFREYGLPYIVRSDNGVPFASPHGDLGLSQFSVWLIQLGIRVERIRPGKPQENGQHERMHRTLGQETARPPKDCLRRQQLAFNRFRTEFNDERPHEGIDMKVPASMYEPSPRPFPKRLPKPEYPSWNRVRRVSSNGTVGWDGGLIYLSRALVGHDVAFEPIDGQTWKVRFHTVDIATFDERQRSLSAA